MSADEMRELSEWWWDEAAACFRVGAQGLAAFARRQADVWQMQAAEARALAAKLHG